MLEFASISSILRAAPTRYAKSFLFTETDGNDLTYFIDHQLEVIVRALNASEDYIGKKAREIKVLEDRLRDTKGLNYHQLALLNHALREPSTRGFLLELPGRGQGYAVARDWP